MRNIPTLILGTVLVIGAAVFLFGLSPAIGLIIIVGGLPLWYILSARSPLTLASTLLGAALGILGALYALFAPAGERSESSSSSATLRNGKIHIHRIVSHHITVQQSSLWQQGDAGAITYLTLMAILFVVAGLGAYLHVRGHSLAGPILLWGACALLLVGTFLGAASVGLFLAPGALLVLLGAITAAGSA